MRDILMFPIYIVGGLFTGIVMVLAGWPQAKKYYIQKFTNRYEVIDIDDSVYPPKITKLIMSKKEMEEYARKVQVRESQIVKRNITPIKARDLSVFRH